jgi:hypothetical protein
MAFGYLMSRVREIKDIISHMSKHQRQNLASHMAMNRSQHSEYMTYVPIPALGQRKAMQLSDVEGRYVNSQVMH